MVARETMVFYEGSSRMHASSRGIRANNDRVGGGMIKRELFLRPTWTRTSTKKAGRCVKASVNARTSEVRSRSHRSRGILRFYYGGSCVRALWQRA